MPLWQDFIDPAEHAHLTRQVH